MTLYGRWCWCVSKPLQCGAAVNDKQKCGNSQVNYTRWLLSLRHLGGEICLVVSWFFFLLLLSSHSYHSLAFFSYLNTAFSFLSLRPTLGFGVYCAFLEHFAMRPRPIPLWHLLFQTPGLYSLVILFLPARGKCLFVFLIVLKPFVLCQYFLSRRNIIEFLGLHPHTPLVPHLAWLEASTNTQRTEHNTEPCVQFTTQSHFMLLHFLISMKPDHPTVSQAGRN